MGFVILESFGPLNDYVCTWRAKIYVLSEKVLARVGIPDAMGDNIQHS